MSNAGILTLKTALFVGTDAVLPPYGVIVITPLKMMH